MNSTIAKKLLDEIDTAINNISSFQNVSELEKSYLAKFLTVYICGIYEESIETIITEMVEKTSKPELVSYVSSSVGSIFRNPDMGNICKLLERFSKRWVEEIKKFEEIKKSAINSIKENKDSIAHGRPCEITLKDIIDYYKFSRPIIEKIDELMLS